MFAVLYRFYLPKQHEATYKKYWKVLASYFVSHRGALGSTLHKAEGDLWVAYSRWPDKATRDASWPNHLDQLDLSLPQEVQEAVIWIKKTLGHLEQIPEICMEIQEVISLP